MEFILAANVAVALVRCSTSALAFIFDDFGPGGPGRVASFALSVAAARLAFFCAFSIVLAEIAA